MDKIVAIAGIEDSVLLEREGGGTMGAVDIEGVTAATQRNNQMLNGRIVDAVRHTQAGNRIEGQGAGIAEGICRIINRQHITATGGIVAVNRQQGTDTIDVAARVILSCCLITQGALGVTADIDGI